MKIITRNASSQLAAKAQALREHHNSWRCFYLNLAAKRGVYSQQLIKHFFINPIVDMLDDMEGTIYLCEDGDIVILFQGVITPVVDKFASQFGDINEQHMDESRGRLFSIFDLSIDFAVFFALCRHKLHDRARPINPAPAVLADIIRQNYAGAMQ